MLDQLIADVLVVGGGTGGTAAALQSARRGAKTILVSESPWLGGMLTSCGVAAPDGNELIAFQTGIWGAFLRELEQRQPQGLDHAWVSFFTYHPRIGAEIFADWVKAEPNLFWISGQQPLEAFRQENRITGVRFNSVIVEAKITLDATELGDILALAEVPYRWGWDFDPSLISKEPSAPLTPNLLTETSPVQDPTWVVIMQDFGKDRNAPQIPAPPIDTPEQFIGSWENYGEELFLNYGRLPDGKLMINWPIRGNDYGKNVNRLVGSPSERLEFWQESFWHSQSFARFIQQQFGRRYGLAQGIFPVENRQYLGDNSDILSAFALYPYYRESRRIQGLKTIIERDILPINNGFVATLPINEKGECEAIAIGNYANDHHYTTDKLDLHPKSLLWGGRWTGTPFTIPYRSLIPLEIDGLLVCEKNISVSHIANGATRLQPVVLGIGQAAGMAAALCIETYCQPRDLSVKLLQKALLTDQLAPAAVVPFFNLPPNHPEWLDQQHYYIDNPENYPINGYCPVADFAAKPSKNAQSFSGIFQRLGEQIYTLTINGGNLTGQTFSLVTLNAKIDQQLKQYQTDSIITVQARLNRSGRWLIVEG